MIDQFYIAGTGLSAYQAMMVNVTNNVSNAQTTGFKKSRVELENLFPKLLEEAVSNMNGNDLGADQIRKKKIEFGSGVKVVDVRKDFTPGTIEVTNKPLDLAIQGDGFFQVRMPDGSLAYTRAGNFHQDLNGYITDANGHPIEPAIKIPDNTTAIAIDTEGKVFVQGNNELAQQEVSQILVARFPSAEGLQSMGQNLYVQTAASGEPMVDVAGRNSMGTIAQFSLEFSNVNIIDEMMQMVIIQRAFELVTKSISTGESMLRNATEIARA